MREFVYVSRQSNEAIHQSVLEEIFGFSRVTGLEAAEEEEVERKRQRRVAGVAAQGDKGASDWRSTERQTRILSCF
jgi:hypothetical protein